MRRRRAADEVAGRGSSFSVSAAAASSSSTAAAVGEGEVLELINLAIQCSEAIPPRYHETVLHYQRARRLLGALPPNGTQLAAQRIWVKQLEAKIDKDVNTVVRFLRADHYATLQLPFRGGVNPWSRRQQPHANGKDVKKAYHRLARLYHPDKNIDADTCMLYSVIRSAYECLSNPDEARHYQPTVSLATWKPLTRWQQGRPPHMGPSAAASSGAACSPKTGAESKQTSAGTGPGTKASMSAASSSSAAAAAKSEPLRSTPASQQQQHQQQPSHLFNMSTKEIRDLCKDRGVGLAGCLERKDLLERLVTYFGKVQGTPSGATISGLGDHQTGATKRPSTTGSSRRGGAVPQKSRSDGDEEMTRKGTEAMESSQTAVAGAAIHDDNIKTTSNMADGSHLSEHSRTKGNKSANVIPITTERLRYLEQRMRGRSKGRPHQKQQPEEDVSHGEPSKSADAPHQRQPEQSQQAAALEAQRPEEHKDDGETRQVLSRGVSRALSGVASRLYAATAKARPPSSSSSQSSSSSSASDSRGRSDEASGSSHGEGEGQDEDEDDTGDDDEDDDYDDDVSFGTVDDGKASKGGGGRGGAWFWGAQQR